jgi:agmatine deiminase
MRCPMRSPVYFVVGLVVAVLLLTVVPAIAVAQTNTDEERDQNLPIGLTEEEMTRLHEIGTYQARSAPPPAPMRKCAQWEPATGVLIRYSYGFGLPYDLIRELAEDDTLHVLCRAGQQALCLNALQANGVNMAHVDLLDIRTDSIWTRDYGPQIGFVDGNWSFVDLVYNRPRPYDDLVPANLGTLWSCPVYGSSLVHSGGNILTDGHGTAFSTNLVWTENSGLTHEQIAQQMEAYLGISQYVVLPDISSTGIHHIDCWLKELDEETLLVKHVDPSNPTYAQLEANVASLQALTNCYGRPYNIVRVYCGSIGGSDVAAYTNALTINKKVLVPVYGISSDAAALATYQAAMPGYEVIGFDNGWLGDDAIRCRALEIHDRYMLVVDTNPLQDRSCSTGSYHVTAYIDDRSEAGLVSDSLLVYWRVAGSPTFNTLVMQATADPDSYQVDIPHQADLVDVEYYVFAKDNTGRRSTRPMVAPGAWYSFNTGQCPPSCEVVPASLDFGTVTIGNHADLAFTITNVGGGVLTGAVSEDCDHYSVVSGGGAYSLTAGQPVEVTVRFEPIVAGTLGCTVDAGGDCADVVCTGVGELPSSCEVEPASLDFGTVTIGDHADLAFTITNVGGGILTGAVSEDCDHYSVVSGTGAYSLTAGQSVDVTVRFEPTVAETLGCTVDAGGDCVDVVCTGVGEELSSSAGPMAIPSAFRLAPNSPNPFSSGTNVSYELPVDCQVRIEIYGILGEQVATLVDEYQKAGYRIAHWNPTAGNAGDPAAGIYLCKLQAGDYVEIRKMVYQK